MRLPEKHQAGNFQIGRKFQAGHLPRMILAELQQHRFVRPPALRIGEQVRG